VRTEKFDLVIPCNDFAVIPLQNERERLHAQTNWYLINQEAFDVALDKAETSSVARELGISTPIEYSITHEQSCEISRKSEVVQIDGQQLQFPIYLKPRSSITREDVENKRSAQRIETAEELAEKLSDDCPADGFLIQENFDGVGIGVEVLASEGKILMQLQHRRLRETIAKIPELSNATEKFVQRLNYTGVAMFEFRYCPDTNDWVFLEINARFWGSLPLAIASGANFPFGLYELLVNDRQEFDSNYVVGKRCRNLIKDLRAFRKQKGSKLHLWNLLYGKDHLDFFAKDDWRPQWVNLCELAKSLIKKAFRLRT